MEPIRSAPAMVAGGPTTSTTSSTSEPPLEASHNLETSPQNKPNIHCDEEKSNATQQIAAAGGQLEAAQVNSTGETSGQPSSEVVAETASSSLTGPQKNLDERKYRLQVCKMLVFFNPGGDWKDFSIGKKRFQFSCWDVFLTGRADAGKPK